MMSDDIVSDLMQECNLTVNGRCDASVCYRRVGWRPGESPTNYSPACREKQAADEITRLRADVTRLTEENKNWHDKYSIIDCSYSNIIAKLSDPELVDVLYNALVENGCCFSEDDLVPALTAIRRHLGLEE